MEQSKLLPYTSSQENSRHIYETVLNSNNGLRRPEAKYRKKKKKKYNQQWFL
jgi:hypothetical protein